MSENEDATPRKRFIISIHDADYIELFNGLGRVSRWRLASEHLLEPHNDLTKPIHMSDEFARKIQDAINGGPTEFTYTYEDLEPTPPVEIEVELSDITEEHPLPWAFGHAFDPVDRGELEVGKLTMCARLVLLAVAKFAADEIRAGKPVTSAPKYNLRKVLSTTHDHEVDEAVHTLLDHGLLIQDRSGEGLFRLPDEAYNAKES